MSKKTEKIVIYSTLAVVLAGLLILLIWGVARSQKNYATGTEMARTLFEEMATNSSMPYRPDVAMLYNMQYSRASDAATIKYVAVFLGYLIVLIGAIFVLYGAKAFYKLESEHMQGNKSSLETSSPGLVLVTLGSILVAVSLFNKSSFDVSVDWGSAAPFNVEWLSTNEDIPQDPSPTQELYDSIEDL